MGLKPEPNFCLCSIECISSLLLSMTGFKSIVYLFCLCFCLIARRQHGTRCSWNNPWTARRRRYTLWIFIGEQREIGLGVQSDLLPIERKRNHWICRAHWIFRADLRDILDPKLHNGLKPVHLCIEKSYFDDDVNHCTHWQSLMCFDHENRLHTSASALDSFFSSLKLDLPSSTATEMTRQHLHFAGVCASSDYFESSTLPISFALCPLHPRWLSVYPNPPHRPNPWEWVSCLTSSGLIPRNGLKSTWA